MLMGLFVLASFSNCKSSKTTNLSDANASQMWKKYNGTTPGKSWSFANGVVSFDPSLGDGGDIVTKEEYQDFELSLEWKIQECGNSGIMFYVKEDENLFAPYLTGPEMQVLDNSCHPDAKIDKHRAGDLYDMIETNVVNVKPAGEWNSIKIVSKNSHLDFYQNGAKVVSFTMHSPEWDAMVAQSKFKDWSEFGKYKSGKIALQDHGDKVWYRNIKIKTL